MDQLFDTLARILATPMSRRKALGLAGGALVTAVGAALGVQPVQAQTRPGRPNITCTRAQEEDGYTTCAASSSGTCCPPGSCCSNSGASVAKCCFKGQCVCANGTCAGSEGGSCPSGCTRCNG